jgi:hypothetical protein
MLDQIITAGEMHLRRPVSPDDPPSATVAAAANPEGGLPTLALSPCSDTLPPAIPMVSGREGGELAGLARASTVMIPNL